MREKEDGETCEEPVESQLTWREWSYDEVIFAEGSYVETWGNEMMLWMVQCFQSDIQQWFYTGWRRETTIPVAREVPEFLPIWNTTLLDFLFVLH